MLAILNAAVIGIAAVMLLNRELESQTWFQAAAGRNAVQATLETMQKDNRQAAILASQRPTLAMLVRNGDIPQLGVFLQTLQAGLGSSLILVCDPQNSLLASAGEKVWPALCGQQSLDGVILDMSEAKPTAWWVNSQDFSQGGARLGKIVVGQAMDSSRLVQIASQTGFEQVLLYDNLPLAASQAGAVTVTNIQARDPGVFSPAGKIAADASRALMDIAGSHYYGIRLPYGPPGLEFISGLNIDDITRIQVAYRGYLLLGILLAAGAGSLLGFLAVRQISQPLQRIGKAAEELRRGDLGKPIPLDIPIKEVHQVARTLEESRLALQHTLNEFHIQKARTEHLMESIVEGIVTLNHLGRITFFSPGAERITGLRQADVNGQRCDDIFHTPDATARFSDFIPSPGQRRNVDLCLADGRLVTLSISGAKLSKSETSQEVIALVLRDVSDEVRMHHLLGDFLANITHEFRTPLSALAASTELLHDQLPDLSPEEIRELLNSIQLGILGLQTLIDNLLEGASMETGQFQVFPKPVRIEEIVYEAASLLQPLMLKYHQNFKVDIPPGELTVRADLRRTIQVMVNLLSNAIKNNPEDGSIGMLVSRQGGYACIQVADQGPGIPAGQMGSIFTRFVRLNPAGSRSQAGAGVGLSVVKNIVEAQGGEVGVSNRPGGGAVFFFTLPIEEAT